MMVPGQVMLGCVTNEAERQQPETDPAWKAEQEHLRGQPGLAAAPPLQQHSWFGLACFFFFLGEESQNQSFNLKSLTPACTAIQSRGE